MGRLSLAWVTVAKIQNWMLFEGRQFEVWSLPLPPDAFDAGGALLVWIGMLLLKRLRRAANLRLCMTLAPYHQTYVQVQASPSPSPRPAWAQEVKLNTQL